MGYKGVWLAPRNIILFYFVGRILQPRDWLYHVATPSALLANAFTGRAETWVAFKWVCSASNSHQSAWSFDVWSFGFILQLSPPGLSFLYELNIKLN